MPNIAASENSTAIQMIMDFGMKKGGNKARNKTMVFPKDIADKLIGWFNISNETIMKKYFDWYFRKRKSARL